MGQEQEMLQQSQGAPSYPEQMPSGAPVASPESMAQMQGGMPPEQMMEQPPMAYGGMPYAAYGMQMGGYGMPFYNDPNEMAYGGVPKFSGGGPGGPPETVHGISAKEVGSLSKGSGWKQGTSSSGFQGQSRRREGEAVEYYTGTGGGAANPVAIAGGLCNKIKKSGNIDEFLVKSFPGHLNGARPTLADGTPNPDWEQAKAKALSIIYSSPEGEIYKKCVAEVESAFQEAEYIKTEDKKKCVCLNKDGSEYRDANGNTKEAPTNDKGECLTDDPQCSTETTTTETEELKCKCTDPVTGEVKEFPIEKSEDCICQDGSKGQTAMGDSPHWSIPAKRNIMRNLLMQTDPAASNVVLPGRAQIQGAYEEYQTKVDTAQSAVNALQSAVMNGMAGSTAQKQSQMKDLLGKSLRASMDAVAGVQSRNVDRQRETNTQQASIDNTNALARASTLNQGLAMQTANQNAKIAAQNKKNYNVLGAMMDADKEMAMRQQQNTLTPQYAAEYDYGFVSPTGVQKPFTGATGPDRDARIDAHMARGMTYEKAVDTVLKEDRLYKGQMRNGGYVYVDSWNPFIM
jgi:hypothetical protein